MTVLIPRTRTINVRLSEAEYVELERFCISSSARSMSDLVRDTLQRFIRAAQEPAAASSASGSANAAQVKELEHRIEKLSAEIAALQASAQGHAQDSMGEISEAIEVRPLVEEEGLPAQRQENEL
jgi:hypothetical protein